MEKQETTTQETTQETTTQETTTQETTQEAKPNKKKDHALKAFALVQRLDPKYWAWAQEPTPPSVPRDSNYDSDQQQWGLYYTKKAVHDSFMAALEAARAGDITKLIEWVGMRLEKCGVRDVHGIIHNKDTKEEWNDIKGDYEPIEVEIHVHILGRFISQKKHNANRTLAKVAEALGVEPQYIERPKQGRYAVDNMLSYLIHVKYTDKYQYAAEDVKTYIPKGSDGEQYTVIYAKRYNDWLRGRADIAADKAEKDVEAIVEGILAGKITKQQILLTDSLLGIYARYRSKIDDTFIVFGDSKAKKAIIDMREGRFKLSVFFITGEAGNGKSLFAEFFAAALQKFQKEKKGEEWQIYDAAATNGMDAYNGEEILILDDLRGGSMRSEDWLKLLDNHRTTPISARYHNKTPVCKTLIITSIKSPLEFFDDCAKTSSEDLNQFLRRITACVQVVSVGDYFPNSKLTIGEMKKVEPYFYNTYDEKPLVYGFIPDKNEYNPLSAVRRLLGITQKATRLSPSPFPEGWETEIFKEETIDVEQDSRPLFSAEKETEEEKEEQSEEHTEEQQTIPF